MPNRLIYRHPAPGCIGKTVRIEYSEDEWRDAPFTGEQRALLDCGARVTIGDIVVVDLVAFYRRLTILDALAADAMVELS